jgi:type I restriction enzyme S subunit
MMTNKKRVPEIRFKGFSGEWEEKKLGEITTINQGLQIAISNRFTHKIDGSYFYITNEFLRKGSNIKYFILNPPESVLCTKDDILMTRTGNTGEVVTNIDGAFHNNFFKIKFDFKKLTKDFLVYFLKLPKTQKLILSLAGVSTIPDLNHKDFYSIKISFSKDINEQTKIGNYFQKLDNLIEQKEQKQKKLKQLKKAMLNKMFPKNGKKVPEIRFKGFSKEWEEKKLEEIFDYERPDDYIVKSTEYSNNYETPVLTANKAFILGYTNELNTFNKPSIIFDDFTLDFKFVDFPYMVKSSALKILTLSNEKKYSLNFMYNLLSTIKIEIMGHARHYISIVQRIKIYVPNIEEQTKIGNYFQKLDKLIELEKKELEKLKDIKKSLLNKMFI